MTDRCYIVSTVVIIHLPLTLPESDKRLIHKSSRIQFQYNMFVADFLATFITLRMITV